MWLYVWRFCVVRLLTLIYTAFSLFYWIALLYLCVHTRPLNRAVDGKQLHVNRQWVRRNWAHILLVRQLNAAIILSHSALSCSQLIQESKNNQITYIYHWRISSIHELRTSLKRNTYQNKDRWQIWLLLLLLLLLRCIIIIIIAVGVVAVVVVHFLYTCNW